MRRNDAAKYRMIVFAAISMMTWVYGETTSTVPLYSLVPPVYKPSGEEFKFWRNETTYTKTYHVDNRSSKASDLNPGTKELPFKTIGRAADMLQPGECVLVHSGVYRECVRPPRGGTGVDKMIGYIAEGEVIVKGSELAEANWKTENAGKGIYSYELKHMQFGNYNPFDLDNLPEIAITIGMSWAKSCPKAVRSQPRGMVFQDGVRLERLSEYSELEKTSGCYYTDRSKGILYVRTLSNLSPENAHFELTTRGACFRPSIRALGFIQVKGFIFEQVANCFPVPQEGALSVCAGHHWLIEENTVRQVNGIGIDIGNGWYSPSGKNRPPESGPLLESDGWIIVRRNKIQDTGVCGIAAFYSLDMLIEENELTRACIYREAVGIAENSAIKTHGSRGTLIRNNCVYDTWTGIWNDYDCRDSRCMENVLVNVEKWAIFNEKSVHDAFNIIDNNVIWKAETGIREDDGKNQKYTGNWFGQVKYPLHSLGRVDKAPSLHIMTEKVKIPYVGGGALMADNRFYQCPNQFIDQQPRPEAPNQNVRARTETGISEDIMTRLKKYRHVLKMPTGIMIADGPTDEYIVQRPFTITLSNGISGGVSYWSTNGVSFNAFKNSTTVSILDGTSSITYYDIDADGNQSEKQTVNYASVFQKFSLDTPERWKKFGSGDMTISYDARENAVKFDAVFDPEKKDWWVYPEYVFASDENLMNAYLVSFEIKTMQQDGAKGYKHSLVQFVSKDKIPGTERAYHGVFYKPAEDWQKVTINLKSELPAALKPEDLKAIRIGMGPDKPKVTYWVKNVVIYFAK